MSKQFAQDLRLARRKAGLTQADLAHLLGITEKEVGKLELGRKLPSVPQLCELSLVYGRSFESLYGELMEHGRQKLRRNLPYLPARTRHTGTFNRDGTLHRIEQRISGSIPSPYENA